MQRIAAALLPILLLPILSSAPAAQANAGDRAGGAPESAPVGEIVIGATFPLSGDFENYGQSAYYGAATRVKMINAAGGVNGKRLVIEWRDNRGDSAQAVRDVRELVEKYRVPAILGPLFSDATMAVRDLAKELEVVVASPLATIEEAGRDNAWVFRLGFSNTQMAEGMIAFQMRSFGAKSCGILYDSRHSFAVELAEIFEKIFTERGGAVVGNLSFVDESGNASYADPLVALAERNPDFIFVISYALEAIELMHAAREAGVSTRFCGSDTWDNELVYDASGTRLIGTAIISSLFESAFNYRPFQIFYNAMEQAGMDTPDAQAASAYDAVSLLATALTHGESGAAIRDGLLAVKRLPLATGRTTVAPSGNAQKPLIIRIVERLGGRLTPVFADRIDP